MLLSSGCTSIPDITEVAGASREIFRNQVFRATVIKSKAFLGNQ